MSACPECGSENTQYSAELEMRHCADCDGVSAADASPTDAEEPSLALPANLGVQRFPEGLVLTYRWSRVVGVAYLLLVMGVLPIGVTLLVIADGDQTVLLFGAGLTLLPLALAYQGLAQLVNSTEILVTPTRLAVNHGPLPWPGAKRLPAGSIDQLYVAKIPKKGKNDYTGYELRAASGPGFVTVLEKVPDVSVARMMEAVIEQYLGIEDRPVKGEHMG